MKYDTAGLDEDDLDPSPVAQWHRWYQEAFDAGVADPNAMTLATVGLDGVPDARIVLVRHADERGLVFFTNYDAVKSRQLESLASAAAVFAWPDLHRQVRLRAQVERASAAESDEYFATRPRGSQLSAWASPQSEPIVGRAEIEARVAVFDDQFAGAVVPRPTHWGGWRLVPFEWEFWQGRANRLHDRLRYQAQPNGWTITRLAP